MSFQRTTSRTTKFGGTLLVVHHSLKGKMNVAEKEPLLTRFGFFLDKCKSYICAVNFAGDVLNYLLIDFNFSEVGGMKSKTQIAQTGHSQW